MNIPIEKTDVLVVGGGTAGFGAAISAARFGLKVVLLEATSKVGGVMAFCPGMPWGGGYPTDHSIGGIMEELVERLTSVYPPAAVKRVCALENFGPEILYDHDIATLTMFEMLEEAGVELRLNTNAICPKMDGNTIKRVRCYDRRGAFEVLPKFVIDCSGDGDISAKAGVPFDLGDSDGNMMSVTVTFHLENVDCSVAFLDDDPYFSSYASAGVEIGALHPDLAKIYLMRGFHKGTVFCNSVHIRRVDGTDPQAVSQATQEGRRRCHQLARFLRSKVPGFENARMTMLSPSVGVRETRKLHAIYQISGGDLLSARKFHDGIVCCDNPVDDVMRAGGEMTHEASVAKGSYYQLPLRSLIPKEISNLMFAGRIVCADPVAFAAVRGMPQCMAMGQAAGTAVALAYETNSFVQEIDPEVVVDRLMAAGMNGLGGSPLH